MKNFLVVFCAIVLGGLVVRQLNLHDRNAERETAAAIADWQAKAEEAAALLQRSSERAKQVSGTGTDNEVWAFSFLSQAIGSAQFTLKSAPSGAPTERLKTAIANAKRCLALAPVPPAAVAAQKH